MVDMALRWFVRALVAALAVTSASAVRFQGDVLVRGDFQVLVQYALDATSGQDLDGGLVEGTIKVLHDSILIFFDDTDTRQLLQAGPKTMAASGHRQLYDAARYRKYVSARTHAAHLRYHHHLGHSLVKSEQVGRVEVDLHVVSLGRAAGLTSEFPADEVQLLPLTILFAIFFLGFVAVLTTDFVYWQRKRRAGGKLAAFASDGIERIDSVSLLRLLSLLLDEAVRMATICILVLAGNGWMILSPKLHASESLAGAMWFLNVFYVLATLMVLAYRTTPNFTNQYYGFVWVFILVVETGILSYALLSSVLLCMNQEALVSKTSRQRADIVAQTWARKRSMRVVIASILLFVAQNFFGAILSATVAIWSRADCVFATTMFCQTLVTAGLVYIFRPRQLATLHSTRAAARREGKSDFDAAHDPWVRAGSAGFPGSDKNFSTRSFSDAGREDEDEDAPFLETDSFEDVGEEEIEVQL
ncbi:Hypothetical Protein FCC1311_024972 [Hondaea fermentalgiana]|uniref:Uncharacterized protein n=1 Tax=Hondaea fermentalgiana TaxID=2315210 RepID=A0A2R5G5G7_9STRA|nr:Hypothetical Protein FCC1311_024972 [Hondaea fermentalgiana]|eukprot:GBG26276.1 Hypothetical Protein FCC1311_024972 [Hondaea fermentalgiana]